MARKWHVNGTQVARKIISIYILSANYAQLLRNYAQLLRN